MHRSFWHRTTTLHWLLLSLIVWAGTASAQTAASGSVAKPARPAAQERPHAQQALGVPQRTAWHMDLALNLELGDC